VNFECWMMSAHGQDFVRWKVGTIEQNKAICRKRREVGGFGDLFLPYVYIFLCKLYITSTGTAVCIC